MAKLFLLRQSHCSPDRADRPSGTTCKLHCCKTSLVSAVRGASVCDSVWFGLSSMQAKWKALRPVSLLMPCGMSVKQVALSLREVSWVRSGKVLAGFCVLPPRRFWKLRNNVAKSQSGRPGAVVNSLCSFTLHRKQAKEWVHAVVGPGCSLHSDNIHAPIRWVIRQVQDDHCF